MRNPIAFLLVMLVVGIPCSAQEIEKADTGITNFLEDLNQRIDRAVVAKDLKFLSNHYANDFVFTHGTGLIDSKESWLQTIRKSKGYVSREHDSVVVEMHKNLAILSGTLTVGRLQPASDGTSKYSLRYVRVYALRKKTWQMISHRTTSEWHHD